jgi:tRNA nucleotidyltransferase (CCA-adding enzyme)
VVHPSINADNGMISLLNSARKVITWHDLLFLEESYIRWSVYFMALIRNCDRKTTQDICQRLELAPRYRKIFTRERFQAERTLYALEKNTRLDNSTLYETLSGLKIELILYMMAGTRLKRVKRAISNYVTNLRDVTIAVTGKDLMERGLKPGPVYREIMSAVMQARLNNRLETRRDELRLWMITWPQRRANNQYPITNDQYPGQSIAH